MAHPRPTATVPARQARRRASQPHREQQPRPRGRTGRPGLPAARLSHPARLLLAGLLLAGLLLAGPGGAAPPPAPPPAPPSADPSAPERPLPERRLPIGESLELESCLRLSLRRYATRQSAVETADWVTVVLRNDCPRPLLRLHVALRVYGRDGKVTQHTLWLLGADDVLAPGRERIERYAVEAPPNRFPVAWSARVLSLAF